MDGFSNSDDEFELMYGNFNGDVSLLRQESKDADSLSLNSINLSDIEDDIDDYGNSDEEFEVKYNSELEVLKEQDVSNCDDLLDQMFNKVSFQSPSKTCSNSNNNEVEFVDQENVSQETSSEAIQEPVVSSTSKRPNESIDEYRSAKRIYRAV